MCYFNDKMYCMSINNNIFLVRDVFGNLTLLTYTNKYFNFNIYFLSYVP